MEGFRIINFVMQVSFLLAHLIFIVWLCRKRQTTPIWYWFIFLAVGVWLWVSGRFMETVIYLFYPTNNDAYVFAANFQFIGNTSAVVAFVIWNLYLAEYDRVASNRLFQAFLFACPIVVCTFVFTNEYHQLMYTKLVMGQRVSHGPMFKVCLIWTYLQLLAGYLISLIHIIRSRRDIKKRLLMFSAFPALPAIAVLVRSLSGIDKLDYTPAIMAISIYCLYLIVFKYNYTNNITASIGAVITQTAHPIWIFSAEKNAFSYANRVAAQQYADAAKQFIPLLNAEAKFEGIYDGRYLKVAVSSLPGSNSLLITATDISDIVEQQRLLAAQTSELEALSHSLEEENRNIDAYLGSLYQVASLERKHKLITHTYKMIYGVFGAMEKNLTAAKTTPAEAETLLEDNIRLAQESISSIRKAVAQLRED